MARTRNVFLMAVNRLGNRLFRFFSSCKDSRKLLIIPGCFKPFTLVLVVLIISACGKKEVPGNETPDHNVVTESHLIISDVSVEPNPTENTPQLDIKALAAIEGDTAGKNVEEAIAFIGKDTIDLDAADGKLDGPSEEIEGKFFVGNHKPGNYELRIVATDNEGKKAAKPVNLKVSD